MPRKRVIRNFGEVGNLRQVFREDGILHFELIHFIAGLPCPGDEWEELSDYDGHLIGWAVDAAPKEKERLVREAEKAVREAADSAGKE